MIDIHNNELLSICHFISLALNSIRASRLHFLHMYVCMYAHIRAQMYTLAFCNRRRVVWVSPIYIRTRTHILMWVTRAGQTHTHTRTCMNRIHTFVYVRAPQGELIKVCYKKKNKPSKSLIASSCKYIFDFPFDFFLLSLFASSSSSFSLPFCQSTRDTDKCMRWPWRASLRCDLLLRTRHTYIRTYSW